MSALMGTDFCPYHNQEEEEFSHTNMRYLVSIRDKLLQIGAIVVEYVTGGKALEIQLPHRGMVIV